MDLMDIRRQMMGVIAGMAGATQETLVITDASLTNSANIDTYFGNLIDGWNTELIYIGLKNPTKTGNKFVGCFSKYGLDHLYSGCYRMNTNGNVTSISRNDWAINISAGDEFIITRFGTIQEG